MKKISISTGTLQSLYGEKEAIKKAKEAGADGVDFNLWGALYSVENKDSVYSKGEEAITEYFSEIKTYADSIGMKIFMTHGNGTGYKNVKRDDDILNENVRRDIIAAKALGAEICVLHTASNYTTICPLRLQGRECLK